MPLLATVSLSKQNPKMKTSNANGITNDDVIDAYKALKEFNGSFGELFKENINNNTKK
jgi:hypothetical protein